MTNPSERQERVKEIEAEIAKLEADQAAATQWSAAVGAREERLKGLRAERDRLLQSSGGEELQPGEKIVLGAPPDYPLHKITPCVSTPAEPNPPGSGEPVAWQVNADRLATELASSVAKTLGFSSTSTEWREVRESARSILYAAPLPSPSEGASDEAETIEALRSALKAAGHTTADGTWIAAGTGRVIATILRALRTRATATGGGDNG